MKKTTERTEEENVDIKYGEILKAIESLPTELPKWVSHRIKVGNFWISAITSEMTGQQISVEDNFGNEIFFGRDNINVRMLRILIMGGSGFDINKASDVTTIVINKIEKGLKKQKSKGATKISPATRGEVEWGDNKIWLATITDTKKEEFQTMIKMYRSKSNIRVFLPEVGRNNKIIEEIVDNIDLYQ